MAGATERVAGPEHNKGGRQGPPASQASPSLGQRTLRLGAKGERVRLVQRRLAELGYEPGPEDGIYGHLTFAAVRELQRHLRFPADGHADRRVLDALADYRLQNLHRPLVVAEPHESLRPTAAIRVLGRHTRLLTGVSVPFEATVQHESGPQEDGAADEGADLMSKAVSDAARKAQLTCWHTLHARAHGGAGHYEPKRLQQLLHPRGARNKLIEQALGPVQTNPGDGSVPPLLHLDLGDVPWGDGAHVLHVVRRLSRSVSRYGGQLVLSVPLSIGRGPTSLRTVDLRALSAVVDRFILVPPVAVGSAGRERRRKPHDADDSMNRASRRSRLVRPPAAGEIGAAVRDIVAEVPSWRCLLLVQVGSIMLDVGPADRPRTDGKADGPSASPAPLPPTVLSYQQALAFAYQNRVRPHWDDVSGRPVIRCMHRGRPVAVWVENRNTIGQKLALVHRARLGGIYLFAVGLEDARIWPVVRQQFL